MSDHLPSPAPEHSALERFSTHLDVLERVLHTCLANGNGPVPHLVNLGALLLLRAASDWRPGCGLAFGAYAEVTLTGELLRHGPWVPQVELPAELAPWQEALQGLQARLNARFGAWLTPAHSQVAAPAGSGPLTLPVAPPAAAPGVTRPPSGVAWLPLLKKRLPFVVALVMATELGIAAHGWNTPPTWLASATLNSGLGSKGVLGSGGDWFTQGTVFANITELLKSRSVLEAVIDALKLEDSPESLLKRLSVSRLGQAGLLRVEGEARDPRAAADLVNTWVREFMKFYANQQSYEARSNHAFFESQTASARARLGTAEKQLQDFKRANVPELQANLPARTSDLLAQRDEAQRALVAAQAALEVVQREWASIRRDPLLTQRVFNSAPVLTAGERLRDLQGHLADARELYGPDSPVVQNLEKQLVAARSQLKMTTLDAGEQNPALAEASARLVQLKAEVAMQRARLGSLNRSLAELQPQTRNASQQQVTYERLQREVKVAETQYLDLQGRLGQSTLVAVGADNLPLSVIDPALPPEKPLPSKLVLKLVLGLLLSLALGLFVAYLAAWREQQHVRARRPVARTVPVETSAEAA